MSAAIEVARNGCDTRDAALLEREREIRLLTASIALVVGMAAAVPFAVLSAPQLRIPRFSASE